MDAHFDFYKKTLSGTAEQQPRWKRAMAFVESALGEALGQLCGFAAPLRHRCARALSSRSLARPPPVTRRARRPPPAARAHAQLAPARPRCVTGTAVA